MKRKIARGALFLLFLLALPFIGLSALHIGFSTAAWSEIERRGISEGNHNALKHAYAASELYSLARPLLGAASAGGLIVKLGELNEWAEIVIKHDADAAAEVYKDLRNNLHGIAAAEWMYARYGYVSPRVRLHLLGKLAADGDLAAYAEDRRIPPLPMHPDTKAAVTRMQADAGALRVVLDAGLDGKAAALRRDLGLK